MHVFQIFIFDFKNVHPILDFLTRRRKFNQTTFKHVKHAWKSDIKKLDECNIPNFQFGMLYIRSSMHTIFYCFWFYPRNFTQLKDPRRELGISLYSYLSFLKF